MLTLDIFKGDAFSVMSLTTRVNEMPYVPGQVGRMGLHTEESVPTTVIAIENYKGTLQLVPNTPRNAPSNQNKRDTRTLRYFAATHLPIEDSITAEEIQNVRPLPGEGDIQAAQTLQDRKLKRMVGSVNATTEYQKLGSVKGVILDADGSTTIYNLFTEFGIAQTTVDMTLGTAGQSQVTNGTDINNYIQDELGESPYTEVVAFCGATFFKRFVSHPTVVDAYKYFEAQSQMAGMNPNRDDLRYKGFRHGGVTYYQYRGNVSGVPFVAASEAHAFPTGVPDLFKTFYAPANYLETANTNGLPLYAKNGVDPSGYNKFMPFEVQSNPLAICTRPKVLIKLTTSN